MFTKNDIIARLESGTPVEAIADEMAKALNEAQVEYAKSQEEAMRKDEEAKKTYRAKRDAMEVILDGFSDYFYAAGEEGFMDELAEANIDEMIESFDAVLELAKSFKNIKPVVESIGKGEEHAESPVAATWDGLMKFWLG